MQSMQEIPERKKDEQKIRKLSIIMPAYNENSTIEEAVQRSLSVDLQGIELELIVVDDGSTDGTTRILQSLEPRENMTILHHEKNKGKGAAVRTALPYVTGEVVVIEDADLELEPESYPRLMEPILKDEADVVFGSRFKGNVRGMTWFSKLGNRVVSLIASILFLEWVSDEATCYKMFRTEVIRSFKLKCTGFEFCPEVTAKTLKNKYRYVEVPVNYNGRPRSSGKKVRLRDGWHAIWTLVKYRFVD
ncbi:MAG: glycosyltransferase family 2 protein [Actinomycetota bacterium]|nr:glycosyltransferase family 2 protein [Actinomycetota bacterium]